MAPSPIQAGLNRLDGGLKLKGHATGASYFTGGFTEINECGGEIVDLPIGSRIYPAQTTQRIIEREMQSASGNSSSSSSITITGNTFTVREEADIDKIAYQLMQLISRAQRNYGGVY